MKNNNYLIMIIIIPSLIIFTLISNIPFSSISTCRASEKVTPYKPKVQYSKPQDISKEPKPTKEIKPSQKKKRWPWIVGGVVLIGLAAAAAVAGGGGDDGGGGSNPSSSDDTVDDTVDVDVSW